MPHEEGEGTPLETLSKLGFSKNPPPVEDDGPGEGSGNTVIPSSITPDEGSRPASGRETPESLSNPSLVGLSTPHSLESKRRTSSTTTGEESPSPRPKPWAPKVARMSAVVPPKGTPNRVARLKEGKEVVRQFMCNTPYVEFAWEGAGKRSVALLDSGADWSLIDESVMTEEERGLICPVNIEGKGVGGESVSIVGEVWRSVEIGGLLVADQRFVVVKNMISSVILGSDFWGRVSPMTFDFNAQVLRLGEFGVEVPLFYGDSLPADGETKVCNLTVGSKCVIPPMTEALVEGKAKGILGRKTYLLEPQRSDDSQIQAPYSIIQTKGDGDRVVVKVANVSQQPITLYEGHVLGTLSKEVSVLKGAVGGTKGRLSSAKQMDWKKELVLGNSLSASQKQELLQTLDKYEGVFYKGGPLPLVDVGVEHTVRLKDNAAPVACRPRRMSPREEQEVRKEIDTLFEQGIIRNSNSPWASPVVCARRADGSLRLALDYRLVNDVSYPATLHPIPLIEDLLDRLADAKYFSVLDAKSGYHQMPMREEDSEVTAFVTPWAHLEWTGRTPFGLKGAGYSFQRMMAVILGESNFTEALCYLDDILIWGTTWEEHMSRLDKVMSKVQVAGLSLSMKKCKFGVDEVQYLGSVIKHGMVSISEQRVQDLRALPSPYTHYCPRVEAGFRGLFLCATLVARNF